MVTQDMNGRIRSDRNAWQKLVRLVWLVSRATATVILTISLIAMLPQLGLAFFAIVGAAWFIGRAPRAIITFVKKFWQSL